MSALIDFIIPILLALVFSFAAAYSTKEKTFSFNIFLIAFSIAIMILAWIPALPEIIVLVPIAILAFLLFKERLTSDIGIPR